MPSLSNKQKHQQFALILGIIIVLVASVFSVWYFNQKNSETYKSTTPVTSERDSYNPAEVTAGD